MENLDNTQNYGETAMAICVVKVTQPVGVGFGSIEAPDLEDNEATRLVETIDEKYTVEVEPGTPGCCIDGRDCVCRLDNSETKPGAKCAGGPLITAYAAAKLTGYFGDRDLSVTEELRELSQVLEAAGIVPGGHCDMTAAEAKFSRGNTGCGADDKLPQIIENIGNEEINDFILGATQLLIANNDVYRAERTRAVVEQAITQPVDPEMWDATTMIDILGGKKVEILDGIPHTEVIVVARYVENTTTDRDAVCKNEGIQVFTLDMWYVDQIARALAGGTDPEKRYNALFHAATAYQVGTLVTLGSGNHRVAQVFPREAA